MIYNSIMFFNELDLLEIRLYELESVVDKFIIVEATTTHSGMNKELHYANNRDRFVRFSDKIIHIVVDDMPMGHQPLELGMPENGLVRPGKGITDAMAEVRERHQRNSGMRGMAGCRDEDIVIVTDADEIPRATSIPDRIDGDRVCRFSMNEYDGYINRQGAESGIIYIYGVANFSTVRKLGVDGIKQCHRGYHNVETIPNGGWHFSWVGGVEAMVTKIESFLHQELNVPQFKDRNRLTNVIESPNDLTQVPGRQYRFVALDDTYPEYVMRHTAKLKHLIHE